MWQRVTPLCDLAPLAISSKTAGGRMGQPTETPGAPATAGTTTALPGLIPDLVSRIHWPRWALVVLALAAGALVLSCIVCAVCCCRRRQRRRKKPGDKEAVGLGSARSTTTTHPVQPEVDDLESGLQPWGRLQLSLEYDPAAQELKVGLRQAAALKAVGTVDCYARASVSTQPGHRHETRVHHDTPCPVFDETCCFHVPRAELPRASVRVQLFNFRRFSEHEPLGELLLPLGSEDLQHVLERWHQLGPPGSAEPEQVGELCCSLRYVPGSGQLTVVVLEARGLSPALAESFVKVQLVLNRRKWKRRKTSARSGTAAPYFNEAFSFPVPLSQIQSVDLVLAVWARGPQARMEPVGKVLLSARASGQPLQHWADMLAHARRPVAQWHRLQPAREVDRALGLQPRLRLPVPRF